jgi:histidinol-phosphate aminotransferase
MSAQGSLRLPGLIDAAVHGGVDDGELRALGVDPAEVLDFSANVAPGGASAAVRAAVCGADFSTYPDRDAKPLAEMIARRHCVHPSCVVIGNGSTELIRLVAQIWLTPSDVALSLGPAFGEYEVATRLARAHMAEHRLVCGDGGFVYDHRSFRREVERLSPQLCWLCSPNNPTGVSIPPACIEELVVDFPGTLFVLDEAYCDLLPGSQWTQSVLDRGNLVVLRSMTKTWALAGLRLGYALAHGATAGVLNRAKPPWNVNVCAQSAGIAALREPSGRTRVLDEQREGRDYLMCGLAALGWKVLASDAGFFLVRVGQASEMRGKLLRLGCLVRDCSSFGLPEYVRISPRVPEDNAALVEAFGRVADGACS